MRRDPCQLAVRKGQSLRIRVWVSLGSALVGCGGLVDPGDDQSGGASSSAAAWTKTVKALCARMVASQCSQQNEQAGCESVFVSERATAERHGCASTYDELTQCFYSQGFYCQLGVLHWRPGCDELINAVATCTGG